MIIQTLVVTVPVALYGGAIIGVIAVMRRRRKTRWPFKESDKLVRGPGESLKRKITELDESFMLELVGGTFVLLAVLAISLALVGWLRPTPTVAVLLPLVNGLVVTGGSAFRIARLWQTRANCFLGWFGERFTADKLKVIEADGFRVFHDVLGDGAQKPFNLDHVIVGPNGVTVVETKTRRKWKRAGGHEVTFDGRMLHWPGGHQDDHGVKQTIANAEWLQRWLSNSLGRKVTVNRVLTLPGWFVRETRVPALRVVNTTLLPQVVKELPGSLEPADADLICRRLEERCRDVED